MLLLSLHGVYYPSKQSTVIIGSYALKQHGYNVEPRDIDIVTSLEFAQELAWKCDKKKGNILFFGDTAVDVSLFTESTTKMLLCELCEIRPSWTHRQVDKIPIKIGDTTIECYLPPIELLYALIRGHLHRIPKISGNQSSNIAIWEKHMKHYQLNRKRYGYAKLDKMMSVSYEMEQIYKTEFDRITLELGDAPSMQKSEDEFFKDNVVRHMPHDELHKNVALFNRGTEEPLFRKFQSDPDSVEMDKDLFMNGTKQEQIETIKEELMVLLLERKILPAVIEHGSDINLKEVKFNEVVCHFMTNLCGNGHSWLRQYCLDHYQLVIDLNTYPQDKLCRFAQTFKTMGKVLDNNAHRRIATMDDFLEYHQRIMENEDNENSTIFESILAELKLPPVREINVEELEQGNTTVFLGYSIDFHGKYDSDSIVHYAVTSLAYDEVNIPKTIIDKFFTQNDILLIESYNGVVYNPKMGIGVVYNPKMGIGLHIGDDSDFIFIIESKRNVTFGIHKFEVENGEYDNTKVEFTEDTRVESFYRSTCDGGYDKDVDVTYLNRYGSCFDELSKFVESLARIATELYVDESVDDHRYDYY